MHLSSVAHVEPSRIRAIAALAEKHPGTLRLFYGEDSLPTPDFLKDAAKRALDDNHTYYTPNAGYPELRQEIVARIKALHGVDVDPDREVVVTASGMVSIAVACRATLGPGDRALVLTPLWPNIPAAIRLTGAGVIEVPTSLENGGFALDWDRLEQAVAPGTRMLALASPSNPTGWTATPDDWRRIVAFCERHDLWLLADSVYERISFDAPVAASPLACPEGRERTIAVFSCSKTYRMTGWRVGFTVAPAGLVRVLPHLHEFVVSHAFGVAQEAALVALRDGEPFVADSVQRYRKHRDLAVERLRAIEGVSLPSPPGAFYLFPKLSGLVDSQAFCEYLVAEHRVGIAPGSAFGKGGEGHVRLCFAVEEPILREALERFEVGWNAWNRRSGV